VFVFAPLLLHGAIGLSLVVTQTPLMAQSPYPPAVRVAMRATGAVALAFLAMHLTEFRFRTPGARLGGSELGTLVAADLSATWGGVPWRGVAYLAGTACVAFHFAAGVWGFLAALPALAQSARRRTWAAWGAAALGGALWIAFANLVVFHATGARLLGVPAEAEGGGEPCPAPDAHRP
jgi:succinate dehydrogenase/fumarate reductase cytochrome b subunit